MIVMGIIILILILIWISDYKGDCISKWLIL